ncbi:MAG TPA: cysteine--tRNA ligase [Atribacteraceae bacterium]|nr:cysteine--tRNA ligase [Atribacteraceae bacterium]
MREVRLYNTLSRCVEGFYPLQEGLVGFYVCGPTVYDLIHIGNARVFVLFDALRRFFETIGFQVRYVQNFTDIDDKIIDRAQQKGEEPRDLAERYIVEYFIDADRLGIKRATHHPRATEHIVDIIDLIRRLEGRGFTYRVAGDILFDTSRVDGYGKLSRKNPAELREGARVEARYRKNHPADFVLWKMAKPGEPYWPSPWGEGRPGWHIECSAMAAYYLGETLDIHAGGCDLLFPHHENEVVQSEAASGRPFVRFWLHNGYLNIANEKMSKSLGNIMTVRELLLRWKPETLRLVLLSTHYRNPINIDESVLAAAQRYVVKLENLLRNFQFIRDRGRETTDTNDVERQFRERIEHLERYFLDTLTDDFNTPQALGVLSEFMRQANSYLEPKRGAWTGDSLRAIGDFLTLVQEILGIIPPTPGDGQEQEIAALVSQRGKAREGKEWSQADQIRKEITVRGYLVEDTPLGPRWYRNVEGSSFESF